MMECNNIPTFDLCALQKGAVRRQRILEARHGKYSSSGETTTQARLKLHISEEKHDSETEEAVKAHARELGIEKQEFYWLAEEALLAELPHPWVELYDEVHQSPYFYNEETGVSQWENPSDVYYSELYQSMNHDLLSPTGSSGKRKKTKNVSERERRLLRDLERQRSLYREKKQSWEKKEAKLTRQAKKREGLLKKEIEEWKQKLQVLQKEVSENGETEAKRKAICSIKKQCESDISRLDRKVEKLKEKLTEKDRIVEAAMEKERALLKNLEQVTAVAELRTRECATLQQQKKVLHAKLNKLEVTIDMLQNKNNDLEAENESLLSELTSEDNAEIIDRLRRELETERAASVQLRSTLRESQAKITQCDTHISDLERVLQTANRRASFHAMEKKQMEEILIAQKLSCKCKTPTTTLDALSPRVFSDSENNRCVLNKTTKREYASKMDDIRKQLEEENEMLKQRNNETDKIAASIVKCHIMNQ